MGVIVTDSGFAPENPAQQGQWLDIGADTDPDRLQDALADRSMIRIDFANFADGRGFTLARSLRRMGFRGRLRACGHVLADQYAMARRSGFDEVEIDRDLAARQPQEHWQARANWREHDYQTRLRRRMSAARI